MRAAGQGRAAPVEGGAEGSLDAQLVGIQTAADLAALEPYDARALMTVTGGRTVYELRGVSCMPLDLMEPTRKGVAVTRRLKKSGYLLAGDQGSPGELRERAAEKMRRYKVPADNLFVFMHTNTFNQDPFYSNGASARFTAITNHTGEVVGLAVRLSERLWLEGFRYATDTALPSDNVIAAELTIGLSVLEAYSRLSYTMWYALAEFVDNSTQSRLNGSAG